jgi:peptidoglycan hydrolase-like protein with peptidoglycan-binding domain
VGAAQAAKNLSGVARWFEITPVTLAAQTAPNFHTIGGLQQALKMLGFRVTVDGDYGPETRQAVTSFQMHAGIVADGIVGVQTEARLTMELNDLHLVGA